MSWLFQILVKFDLIHDLSKSELIPFNHQNYDITSNKLIYTKTILESWTEVIHLKKQKKEKKEVPHNIPKSPLGHKWTIKQNTETIEEPFLSGC